MPFFSLLLLLFSSFFFFFWTCGAGGPAMEGGRDYGLGILMGEDGIPGVNFAENRSNSRLDSRLSFTTQ